MLKPKQIHFSKQKDKEIIEQLKLSKDELSKLLKEEIEKKPTDKSTETQTMVEARNKEIQELQNVITELRQETKRLRTRYRRVLVTACKLSNNLLKI